MDRPRNAVGPFSSSINRSLRTHARFAVAASVLLVTAAAVAQDTRVVLVVLAVVIAIAVLHARAGRRGAGRRFEAQPGPGGLESGSVDAGSAPGVGLLAVESTHTAEPDAADWRVDPAGAEGQPCTEQAGPPASEPSAAGKGFPGRARRRRSRTRAAEPVAASWVQVAPGRFVRVEDSDQAVSPAGDDASPEPADDAEASPTAG